MIIKNYYRGYYEQFECVIHGRIIVQGEPELDIIRQLLKKMPVDCSYPWIKLLAIERMANKRLFCLGVTATEYIANKLNLRGYKNGNYMFDVV